MRNYSRENLRIYYRQNGLARPLTVEKPNGAVLKQSEVRVGKYKYDNKDELGKGYSSNVFKGIEILKPHKRYAIKVINLKKFRGSNLQMLESQINIHKNLDHQHIVKLHEVIKTSHHYYLILQYCPHGNLNEYIAQKKQLTQTNALQIITQVFSAYKYLLNEGIIHRDIKPANILRIGNKWKISDFGFATKSKFGFKDRMNVGTPLYMAPESLKKNIYSYKSDLYSIGIVLFEMLVGKTPHEAQTEKELLDKVNNEIILPKHLKNVKLIQFLSKACQINEAKRINKQEFEAFDLCMGQQSVTHSLVNSNSAITLKQRKFSGTTDDSISKNIGDISPKLLNGCLSSKHLSSNTSKENSFTNANKYGTLNIEQCKPNKNPMIANKEILSMEFEYAHYFYATIQNVQSFHLEQNTKNMFILTIFKLLLKIVRLLCDKNSNHFQLKNWEEYQYCKLHQQLYSIFTNTSQRYQKQYLQFIKHNDIKVIRAVNRKFPQLCHNAPLNIKFYQNFKQFMLSVIRQHNNQITKLANQSQEQLNDRYEALDTAYTIYKFAQTRSANPLAPLFGQKLIILQDYTDSKRCKADILNLKRVVKTL